MSVPFVRSGATLAELIVVLAVLGIMASVVGLTARTAEPRQVSDGTIATIAAARREALLSGRPVTLTVELAGRTAAATAWPDGSISADSALAVDPLSGRAHARR